MAEPQRAFVLGHPIEHSLSPMLHQTAYDTLGLPIHYGRIDTVESQLAERFALAQQGNICGFSCTMPLKSAVKQFLDEETDFARSVGVINTVYWRSVNGVKRAIGHNTDVAGIANALDWAGSALHAAGSFAIVGGGGTATSAVAALKYLGASSIDVFVRSTSRVARVVEVAQRIDVELNFYPLSDFSNHYSKCAIAVSTLPAHAADRFCADMNTESSGILLDVSYDPWPSALAHRWVELGGSVVSGKDMLVYQAIDQIKLFSGLEPTDSLGEELKVINAMCRAIGLQKRDRVPKTIYAYRQLLTDR